MNILVVSADRDSALRLRTKRHHKRDWATPVVRGYRIGRRPLGSEALGCAIEGVKGFLRDIRHRDGVKS